MKGGDGKSKGNKKGRGKANPDLEAALEKWEPVIGIEIHAQLSSTTKVWYVGLAALNNWCFGARIQTDASRAWFDLS